MNLMNRFKCSLEVVEERISVLEDGLEENLE